MECSRRTRRCVASNGGDNYLYAGRPSNLKEVTERVGCNMAIGRQDNLPRKVKQELYCNMKMGHHKYQCHCPKVACSLLWQRSSLCLGLPKAE